MLTNETSSEFRAAPGAKLPKFKKKKYVIVAVREFVIFIFLTLDS